MNRSMYVVAAVIVGGTLGLAVEAGAQGGTTPQSQSMGESRSGSAIDKDKGTGGVPTDMTKKEFNQGFTGQAPGIGEKGSGQQRSTMERSGGQAGAKEETAQSSDLSEGKTASAMEKQAHDERNK